LTLSLIVFEIRPLIAWNLLLKIGAKPLQMETWLLLTGYRKLPVPYPMVRSPTPYGLPFSHNISRLVYRSAFWPFKIIRVNDFQLIWKQYATSYLWLIAT